MIAVVTEFGRTARINGTEGTRSRHRDGRLYSLAARSKAGRVITDWPGLKEANLRDGRDLKPTTDLRAVMKGI